mmetsp:Transcript_20832/g.45647  ORF Transcript_20832/g.45647 Transcript_20832/m.45647 type:complete len:311 (+) Transcript_20832:305-1237(+)
MHLDVRHIHGGGHARLLEHILGVVKEVRIFAQAPPVRLEVHHVHLVEADQRHKEADVRLRESGARQVPPSGQMLLCPIHGRIKVPLRLVVRLLRRREPALVHAIVDLVRPKVNLVNDWAEGLRVEVQGGIRGKLVEVGVEEANDLGALVVHDRPLLLVPQNGHAVLAAGGACDFVQITHKSASLHRVWDTALGRERTALLCTGHCLDLLRVYKLPPAMNIAFDVWASLCPRRVNNRDSDDILETLHVKHCQRPVGPGASIRHVQVIAIFCRRELPILGNCTPKDRVRSLEVAFRPHLVQSSLRRRHCPRW